MARSLSPAGVRIGGAVLVFLLSVTVYLLTLAPTVTFVDSGELIVAARSLGVAHPPGFPLYVLLAHLATLIPFGNIALRVNFASALFAALAVAFLYLVIVEASLVPNSAEKLSPRPTGRSAGGKRQRKKLAARGTTHAGEAAENTLLLSLAPALVAALQLAFSRTLWSFATVSEVYTLNTLLIVIIFFLLLHWRNTGENRFLYLAAFIFGSALGVHHVTVLVIMPALAIFVYRTAGRDFFKSKRMLYAALISLAGLLLVYSYLPLAAARWPVINWGDPRTAQRIWWHVTARQYQVFLSFSAVQIANQAIEFAKLAAREFNPVWFPFAIIFSAAGLVELFRRDRTIFWFLSLVIAVDLAYALNYEIAEDKGAYYLPAFVAAAIAAGPGVRLLLRFVTQRWPHNRLASVTAIALVLLVPLAAFAGNYPFCNRHNFFLARDYVDNIQGAIAPGGMLLTSDWQVYSPLLYMREVEQQRRDVVAIDVNMLRRPWYYDYLKAQYPNLIAENHELVAAFLANLRQWEQDPQFARNPALRPQIQTRFHELILAFVSTHRQKAPVYITWEIGLGFTGDDQDLTQSLNEAYQLVPQGLVFQLSSDRDFHQSTGPELITQGLNDGSFKFADDDVVLLKVFPTYVNMLVNRGKYLQAFRHYGESIQLYRQALVLDPTSANAQKSLSEALGIIRSRQ